MKILIFGIGGIGGFVGGALAKISDDIYFYSRGENGKTIREKGIKLDPQNAAFREKRAVLFYDGEKVRDQ